MTTQRFQMRYMNPYDLHKVLVNEYILRQSGDTDLLQRNTSQDRTDFDVIRDNHRFLWDDKEPSTWEEKFAKKYYDRLFKEYCIGDLSLYKENKVALRWRIEKEVLSGKGQFICGNKTCQDENELRTWEVNFAYREKGEKRNALVKIRLCPRCSYKLNYHKQQKEVKRLRKKSVKDDSTSGGKKSEKPVENLHKDHSDVGTESGTSTSFGIKVNEEKTEVSPWDLHVPIEQKSRDEEMEEYFESLLL